MISDMNHNFKKSSWWGFPNHTLCNMRRRMAIVTLAFLAGLTACKKNPDSQQLASSPATDLSLAIEDTSPNCPLVFNSDECRACRAIETEITNPESTQTAGSGQAGWDPCGIATKQEARLQDHPTARGLLESCHAHRACAAEASDRTSFDLCEKQLLVGIRQSCAVLGDARFNCVKSAFAKLGICKHLGGLEL
jgi:hypothetical protein